MRSLARCTAALCVAAGSLMTVLPAHAAPSAILCAIGSQTASYSPPLTNSAHTTDVTIRENYSCTSPLSGVSSGVGSASIQERASCLLAVQPGVTDVITYGWNTGASSTITFNRTNVARAVNGTTTITSLGSVTSGLGKGSRAIRVVILPAPDLIACFTTGLAAQTGVATLAVA
jgi:hypothetical protein